jgi:hopanoid biosynthesis associated radical SAM protein HpnH
MKFTYQLTANTAKYMVKKKLSREDRYPTVMMLEPLHACNLTCTGCGRIREYKDTIHETLTLEECLASVEECGAPIVSICGGEPLIYPPIVELVNELIRLKKGIILCTNGMYLRKKLPEFTPSDLLFFNIHLDGLETTHDLCVEKSGVFKEAIEAIKAAKAAGFHVCSNTTVYNETDMEEIDQLFEFLTGIGVEGFMLSPAYGYSAVDSTELFLSRDAIREKFKDADKLFKKYRLNTTPQYMDFLRGERELECTPWGCPTRNVQGWKKPCYLMTDGHYDTFNELMEDTKWENYGPGKDPRCADCMMHSGFEPTVAVGTNGRLGDTLRLLTWQLQ